MSKRTQHIIALCSAVLCLILVVLLILNIASGGIISHDNAQLSGKQTASEQKKSNKSDDNDDIEDDPDDSDDESETEAESESYLQVAFLNVGQANSTWLRFAELQDDGEYVYYDMLVDAGNYEDGAPLSSYLQESGVTSLTIAVITHGHEDHSGGMATVLSDIGADTVILPNTASAGYWYTSAVDEAAEIGAEIVYPTAGMTGSLGGASWQILCCDDSVGMESVSTYDNDNLNLSSIVIRVKYGDVSFMLMADAETTNEDEIMASGYETDSDIIQAGHHGSYTGNSETWIRNAVSPDIVVYSCGKDNEYGLPNSIVRNRYQLAGTQSYITENGSVFVVTDGEDYTIQYVETDTDG